MITMTWITQGSVSLPTSTLRSAAPVCPNGAFVREHVAIAGATRGLKPETTAWSPPV